MILFLGTTPAVQRSMTFERITPDAVNRATDVVVAPAGKSVNAARIAHALGADVLATGFLGGDTGEVIRAGLDRQHVAHDFVTVNAPTRVCVTVIDREQGHVTELVEEHAAVENRDYVALLQRLRGYAGQIDVGVLSGSLPPRAPSDFYARCIEALPQDTIKWIVDARGEPLRHILRHRPFLVKPNAGELSATVNLPVETDEQLCDAIRALIDQGPCWAVVTRGPLPVVVSDGLSFFKIIPPRVQSVSPIGAGDAFAGALATALARADEMEAACAFATTVAAASTLSPLAGEVNIDDVERIRLSVRVEKM